MLHSKDLLHDRYWLILNVIIGAAGASMKSWFASDDER